MTTGPLVSVLMPVYNAERYLREAIESVFAQTHARIELICVDDGSQDGSRALLEEFGGRLVVVSHEINKGIAQARNSALALARGKFVAFMDADDLWEPNKIELQLEAFAKNPLLDISFVHMRCFISPELPEDVRALRYCPPPMPGYLAAAMLGKAVAVERVGMFDPRFRVGEFIDWLARAKAAGLVTGLLPEELLLRRIHETNTGVVARDARGDYLRVVREAHARKKAARTA